MVELNILVSSGLSAGKENHDDQASHQQKRGVPAARQIKQPATEDWAKRAEAVAKRLHHAGEACCPCGVSCAQADEQHAKIEAGARREAVEHHTDGQRQDCFRKHKSAQRGDIQHRNDGDQTTLVLQPRRNRWNDERRGDRRELKRKREITRRFRRQPFEECDGGQPRRKEIEQERLRKMIEPDPGQPEVWSDEMIQQRAALLQAVNSGASE